MVGSGLAGGQPPRRSASSATTCTASASRTRRAGRTASPRRAASTPRRTTSNDGDSVHRLFYDTVKGGDFRSREANVYRLAEVSVNIIDQCVAQGVPFAREYGGLLANRSFGGAQVSRTFYARGQTGQQLLLGAYQALERQIAAGQVKMYPRTEMLDLVLVDGHAGASSRATWSPARSSRMPAMPSSWRPAATATSSISRPTPRAATSPRSGAPTSAARCFANPCYTQIHPTCIPVSGDYQSKLTLMSESLRNDGRVWVPKKAGDTRSPTRSPRTSATTTSSASTRASATSRRATSRPARRRRCVTKDAAWSRRAGRLPRLRDAIERLGRDVIGERYGNLFEMYERITGENPYQVPMRIYPGVALHDGRLLGRLQPDEQHPRALRGRRGNFSDHGANRLGASALMQGLADGYFILPDTIPDYSRWGRAAEADKPGLP